jgi:hypothetical protein
VSRGVEPVLPVQGADLDVVDVAPRPLAVMSSLLNEPTVVSHPRNCRPSAGTLIVAECVLAE